MHPHYRILRMIRLTSRGCLAQVSAFFALVVMVFALGAGAIQADPIVLDFEGLTSMPSQSTYSIPLRAQLSDAFLEMYGVRFSSGSPYVAVVDLGPGHAISGVNGIGGSTPTGLLTYDRLHPVVASFFDPHNPSVPAITNFVSVRGDLIGTGQSITLKAFDVNGRLIAAVTVEDTGGALLAVTAPGIHSVHFLGTQDFGGVALDNFTFNPVTPFPPTSYALRFSADGQRALVSEVQGLDITGPLTLEAWVKPEAGILTQGYTSIVSKQLNGTGYMIATNNTANTSVQEHRFTAEVAGKQIPSASQPVLGAWQHIAAVWEDGQLKLYVNGQLDGVIDTPHPLANSFPVWIGSSPFGADTTWRGAIDEVRVWAVARTQTDIQVGMEHYLTGREPGLRAYWSFDEGAGQIFADATGGHSGILGDSSQPDPLEPEWVSGVHLLPARPASQSHITSQFEHACVVKPDATLWCWGEAASGRLGNGTTRPPQLTPIPVPLPSVAQVDAGIHQTCAVTTNGTAWCWGDGGQYQLGYGDTIGQLLPRQVAGLTEVAAVVTNDAFSCARKVDETAWCWGYGGDGALGYGGRSTRRTPVAVSQATGLTAITQLAVSDRHTCAVDRAHTAWCWGANTSGQLGDATTTRRTLPTPVAGLPAVQQVVAGAHHSCALTTADTVWCWGENLRGELGIDAAPQQMHLTPVQVQGLSDVTYLSAQVWHTCAVKADGTVWCWGRNSTGQLGDGTTTDRHSPVQVVGLTDVAQVSAGYYTSCALKHNGTTWCWGAGGSGRLGNGSVQGSLIPVPVRNIP